MHHNKGFALIETLLYIALFGVLIGSATTAAYTLISASQSSNAHNTAVLESAFVIQKINWALQGMPTITKPTTSVPYAKELGLVRSDGTTVVVRYNSTEHMVEMSTNAAMFEPLTKTTAQAAQFHLLISAGVPVGVEASTTVGGVVSYTKHYTRGL